ncbi:hypothetical protein CEXT_464201 [Caerostris extrusa]|uniref:Uncharacterized protein n=1 Tax=Caerostris extrusa TaxID=172846 RepID=A0AAV4P0J5_CAEEX|nr:hypothetical protein CEXT_464201 [Caerostris extrusa]
MSFLRGRFGRALSQQNRAAHSKKRSANERHCLVETSPRRKIDGKDMIQPSKRVIFFPVIRSRLCVGPGGVRELAGLIKIEK